MAQYLVEQSGMPMVLTTTVVYQHTSSGRIFITYRYGRRSSSIFGLGGGCLNYCGGHSWDAIFVEETAACAIDLLRYEIVSSSSCLIAWKDEVGLLWVQYS